MELIDGYKWPRLAGPFLFWERRSVLHAIAQST